MKKQIISMLLVLAMVLSVAPVAFAAEVVDSGTCGKNLTWTLTDDGTLTISGIGTMTEYESGTDAPWNGLIDQITKVVIGEGVTTIGKYAFYGMTLSEVQIPEGVTAFGEWAFTRSAIDTIKIPATLTSSDGAFIYARLKYVEFANEMSHIPKGLFGGNCNIGTIVFSESIESFGDAAFSYSTAERIDFATKEQMDAYMIHCTDPDKDNRGLYGYWYVDGVEVTHLTFPEEVTQIGLAQFGCKSVDIVTVPASVESLYFAFAVCENLKDIYFLGDAPEGIYELAFGTKEYYVYTEDGPWTVYYPEGNDTWDTELMRSSPVDVTWVPYDPNEEVAYHEYSATVVAPTCTQNGYTTYTCVCGESYQADETAATGHSFGAWTQVKAPTIAEEGLEERACGCGEKESRAVAKLMPAPTEPAVVFEDVSEDQWFYDTVQWAVAEGITNGTTATTFEPDATCTRNQVVTFLWRAAGEPEPASAVNPFVDVKEGDYFYKAVLWAVEKGITTGTSATTFAPEEPCTRGQVVTFLHRAAEKPAASGNNPFSDVGEAYYTDAVLWAVGEGITTGVTNTTFEPESTCTRAQIVTFLYRNEN